MSPEVISYYVTNITHYNYSWLDTYFHRMIVCSMWNFKESDSLGLSSLLYLRHLNGHWLVIGAAFYENVTEELRNSALLNYKRCYISIYRVVLCSKTFEKPWEVKKKKNSKKLYFGSRIVPEQKKNDIKRYYFYI